MASTASSMPYLSCSFVARSLINHVNLKQLCDETQRCLWENIYVSFGTGARCFIAGLFSVYISRISCRFIQGTECFLRSNIKCNIGPSGLWILCAYITPCIPSKTDGNTLMPKQDSGHFADDNLKSMLLIENVRISKKMSMIYVP